MISRLSLTLVFTLSVVGLTQTSAQEKNGDEILVSGDVLGTLRLPCQYDAIASLLHKAQAQIPHPVVIILPGERFPDSHVFYPHGDFAVSILSGKLSEKLGQGI